MDFTAEQIMTLVSKGFTFDQITKLQQPVQPAQPAAPATKPTTPAAGAAQIPGAGASAGASAGAGAGASAGAGSSTDPAWAQSLTTALTAITQNQQQQMQMLTQLAIGNSNMPGGKTANTVLSGLAHIIPNGGVK